MQIINRLAPLGAVVDDDSVPVVQLLLLRHFLGDQQQVSEQLLVLLLRARQLGDRLAGKYQQMDRRLGIDVLEHDALFVLVDEATGDYALGDLAEEGVPPSGGTLVLRHGPDGLLARAGVVGEGAAGDRRLGAVFEEGCRRSFTSCFFSRGDGERWFGYKLMIQARSILLAPGCSLSGTSQKEA